MVRGVYIQRGASERLTFDAALDRYLTEVTPTKKPATQRAEKLKAKPLREFFGDYALAAIGVDLVARYRDQRLATASQRVSKATGKATLLRPATVRLELALLGHVFTTAIKEWRIGLVQNPVHNIRKPSAGEGRDRRLSGDEETRVLAAVDAYSNPMLGWIVRIALETGMRSSEITGLSVRQIDTKRRIVRLADTKNDSARTVPMTRTAQALFEQALVNPLRPKDCDLCFSVSLVAMASGGRTISTRPGTTLNTVSASPIYASMTCAMKLLAAWSKRASAIRKWPRSVATSRSLIFTAIT